MLNVENRTPYPGKEGRVRLRQDNGQVIEGVLEMADDATAPGTPWNRQSGRLLQADIRTYPVAEGQTINQGDVVDIVDGQIQKTLTPQKNVETIIDNRAWDYTKTEKISASKLAIMSNRASATPTLNVWVFDVSAEGIISNIKSSDVIGDIVPYNNVNACSFSVISEEKIVVFYNQSTNKIMRAKVCTVNENNTLSFGNARTTEEFSDFPSVIESIFLDNDTIIVFSNDSGLNARICTISGTTPTWASSTYRLSGNTSASYISATRLPDSGTTRRVCVCYSDGGDSNKGKAVIVSIDASNNATWGSPVVFNQTPGASGTVNTRYIACSSNGNNVIAVYSVGDQLEDVKHAIVISANASGNSLSVSGSPFLFSKDFTDTAITSCGEYFVLFANDGVNGYTNKVTVSGNQISIANPYSPNSSRAISYPSITYSGNNQVVLAYADNGNSFYGTATTLTVSGNQIAGSFLDSSKDAIALQSGTSGQSIEVIYSGITNVDWVTEGQTITSEGVYGAGLLDGVLQVWSKDRPLGTQIVAGTYVGTGTYGIENPNSVSLGFEAKFFIVGENSSYWNIFIPGIENSFCPTSSEYRNYPSFYKDRVQWYHSSNANYQFNTIRTTYYYVAIG